MCVFWTIETVFCFQCENSSVFVVLFSVWKQQLQICFQCTIIIFCFRLQMCFQLMCFRLQIWHGSVKTSAETWHDKLKSAYQMSSVTAVHLQVKSWCPFASWNQAVSIWSWNLLDNWSAQLLSECSTNGQKTAWCPNSVTAVQMLSTCWNALFYFLECPATVQMDWKHETEWTYPNKFRILNGLNGLKTYWIEILR